MHLTDHDLKEFQALWKKETGKDISLETAREYAANILGLVEIVARPSGGSQQTQA